MIRLILIFAIVLVGYIVVYYTTKHKSFKTRRDISRIKFLANVLPILLSLFLGVLAVFLQVNGIYNIWATYDNTPFEAMDGLLTCGLLFMVLIYLIFRPLWKLSKQVLTSDNISEFVSYCLYLRPFSTDTEKHEKRLIKAISKYWATVAVGNPNSLLPNLKSVQVFLADDEWQECVNLLMSDALLIFLRVGDTDGAMWEISESHENTFWNKTVFLVYSESEFNLLKKEFKKHHEDNFPADIPSFDKKAAFAIYHNGETWTIGDASHKSGIRGIIKHLISLNSNLTFWQKTRLDGTDRKWWRMTIPLQSGKNRHFVIFMCVYFIFFTCGFIGWWLLNN